MKLKNYHFYLRDVERDFLSATRKRMIIGDEAIDIYIYNSNKDMEKDARGIDRGGASYSNDNTSIHISWVSKPHFYKSGNIIVQYIGEKEKIISDLEGILAPQFAGYK